MQACLWIVEIKEKCHIVWNKKTMAPENFKLFNLSSTATQEAG